MDLRRVPSRAADVPSDPELLAAIRAEIRASGPLTFARFMEIALYTPARGYYRATAAPAGSARSSSGWTRPASSSTWRPSRPPRRSASAWPPRA